MGEVIWGLFSWALNAFSNVLVRKRQHGREITEEEAAMWRWRQKSEWGGRKPRNVDSHHSSQRQKKAFPLEPLSVTLWAPWLHTLTSEAEKIKVCCFKSPDLVLRLGQPQESNIGTSCQQQWGTISIARTEASQERVVYRAGEGDSCSSAAAKGRSHLAMPGHLPEERPHRKGA